MRTAKRLTGLLISLAVLSLPLAAYWKHQTIFDWWRLRGYVPPASVSALATQDSMNSAARHIFYVNHPQLVSDVSVFRNDCQQNEQTIVLGCYIGNQNGIFLYDVQDSRLAGVEQVTAAHEMLHAAYDRLSATEKKYVNGLLMDYYNHGLHDQRLQDTINAYKKTEPGDVINEMHSVFGTEVANLPLALETYYRSYFSNRAVVVAFAQGYEAEFTNRLNAINADDAQLAAIKGRIDALENSLNSQLVQLESDRNRLDGLRASGNIAAYNAAIPGFNSEVAVYNRGIIELRGYINQYNQLVSVRNAAALELRSLDSAIDTRLTTQSAQ